MEAITNPQNYDICFSISSLLLIGVTMVINASEEIYDSKQKRLFGILVLDALILNMAGLLHNFWMNSSFLQQTVSIEMNNALVIIEKIASYALSYISTLYVMAIFRFELDKAYKKALLFAPVLYTTASFVSGFVWDFFFYFTDKGELEYRYFQGASVNLCLFVYFPFAAYLYVKYARGFSTEKLLSLMAYYVLMLAGIPIRIITKSSSIFEFSVSVALLLCVYTFQNPSEFSDSTSGAGTRNALHFSISNNLAQKKIFTVFGIAIDRLDVIIGGASLESVADLLGQITSYLKQLCSEGNIFYDDDGNYLMIYPGVDPDDQLIEKTAEQIRKKFREPWIMNEQEIKLIPKTYAIGFPDEIDSLDKFSEVRGIMQKALVHQNRDVLRVSDLNLKHVEHDKKIDSIVKRALDDGLLEVYYQPIYNPEAGKFTCCEALLRLRDPQLGFISPAVFMPVAERNGTVIAIDNFVLASTCEMLQKSDAVDLGIEYVEVILSVVDCIQTNLAGSVIDTMNKYGIRPDQINLEITETISESMNTAMDENINTLIDRGLTFSMDDFGTGYSNLARIASVPVDIFKLDKSIVQSAFESGTSYMVMLNYVKIIKALGKKIVAEGVETEEQARQIIRLGCDYIQGFFYARPMPKAQFLEFLRHNNR